MSESKKIEVKAIAKYIKMSPFKIRRVAKLIRGSSVLSAEQLLQNLPQKGAFCLKKVLVSAKSNAVNNHKLIASELFISEIQVNEGPMMKRFQARARGRIFEIQKKSSHVLITVTPKGDS
jgi:large subunit ribosomal protein L22